MSGGGFKFTTLSRAPPLLLGRVCAPSTSRPRSFGLSPASPTPSPPGLPLVCCRENRESGLRPARHPLGMLGRRDRLAAGWARPSSQGGGAGACRDCGRAPPAHLRGRWEPPGSAGSPERPPTPSLPASGGGASRGGGEVRRRESDLRAARGSLESKAQPESGVRLPTAHRGGAGRGGARWEVVSARRARCEFSIRPPSSQSPPAGNDNSLGKCLAPGESLGRGAGARLAQNGYNKVPARPAAPLQESVRAGGWAPPLLI